MIKVSFGQVQCAYKCFKLSFKIKEKSVGNPGFWKPACQTNSHLYFIIKGEKMSHFLVYISSLLAINFAHDSKELSLVGGSAPVCSP